MVTLLARKNEEQAIRNWIESLGLPGPDSLVEYRMILDVDWEGDPKVILYFILPDSLGDTGFHEVSERIYRRVMDSYPETGIEHFPSPRFRLKSEQDELDEEERKEEARIQRRSRK